MGFALAGELHARGAEVCLIAGPTPVEPPVVAEVVRVRSAADMHQEVLARAGDVDVVVMAAAVADYTPEETHAEKVAKTDAPLTLRLTRTPDILGDLGRLRAEGRLPRPVLVGFAAETSDLIARARAKLIGKHADLIVANDVSAPGAGFDVETNAVTLVTAESQQAWPVLPKRDVARLIVDRIEALCAKAAGV